MGEFFFALSQGVGCFSICVWKRAVGAELKQGLFQLLNQALLFIFECFNFLFNLLQFWRLRWVCLHAVRAGLQAATGRIATACQIDLGQGQRGVGCIFAARIDQHHFKGVGFKHSVEGGR